MLKFELEFELGLQKKNSINLNLCFSPPLKDKLNLNLFTALHEYIHRSLYQVSR